MESFLDDYLKVRLILVPSGLVTLALQWLVASGEDPVLPILPTAVALSVAGIHAVWSRIRKIRTPRALVGLDLTLFGPLMVLVPEQLGVTTAALALFTLVTVMLSSGWWMAAFLAYLASWYGISYFMAGGLTTAAVSSLLPVLLLVAGMALVMSRVKGWLSRLDSNRSQMLGTVSHELKNNLTGMIGMTELVSTEQVAPEEVRALIELAHMHAGRRERDRRRSPHFDQPGAGGIECPAGSGGPQRRGKDDRLEIRRGRYEYLPRTGRRIVVGGR